MKLLRWYFCLAFFWSAVGYAQLPSTLWFNQLSKEDGLGNTSASFIVFDDSHGFIWIGHQSGLDRFDGTRVVSYTEKLMNTATSNGSLITGNFFEDRQQNIWFCSEGAIVCYLRATDQFATYQITHPNGIQITSGYKAIFLERDSLLWVRVDETYIHTFNIHTLAHSPPLAQTHLKVDVFPGVNEKGQLRYLFVNEGSMAPGMEVYRFNENQQKEYSFLAFDKTDMKRPALNVHDVLYQGDTTVWFTADTGMVKWNLLNDALQLFPTGYTGGKDFTVLDSIHFLVTEGRNLLYTFNTQTGKYTPLRGRLIKEPMAKKDPIINRPYLDKNGIIWGNSWGTGLLFVNPEKIKFQSIPKFEGIDGRTNYSFRTMLEDDNGRIWCSTHFNGIFLLDNMANVLQHYHPDNSYPYALNSAQVNHMLYDNKKRLWIGTGKGVSIFDTLRQEFIPVKTENDQSILITYLYQLKSGKIIAASLNDGILEIIPAGTSYKLQTIYPDESGNEWFTYIFQDEFGSIYVSSNFKDLDVFQYKPYGLKALTTINIKGYANGVHEQPGNNKIWLATSTGLVLLDKSNLNKNPTFFRKKEGFADASIQSLIPHKDHLWLGTSGGISRFDLDTYQIENFSLADGIRSLQFHAMSACKRRDGMILMGGENGITHFNPASIQLVKNEVQVELIDVLVNDEVYPELKDEINDNTNILMIRNLKFEFDDNTLSFNFVGMDYSDPKNVQLAYKMEGIDDNWVILNKGDQGFARYSNLPPNQYVFKVKAANSDGVWSDGYRSISILIRPPWYQTVEAYILFGITGLLLLYGGYRIRVRQIRKEEAFKRKEAEYKQLVAETETAVLRLQMNPHFIFNSMNSISSYIAQKDIKTANDYLNRFANLMRKILKLAKHPFLSVGEEMELLEQYLETEAMRFEDKIHYQITTGPSLDPDEVIIPTMILQPFVENAIWHGLAGKEGRKQIHIQFKIEKEQLICIVEDNGIGRAAAQVKKKSNNHVSKAISITKERLKRLEEQEAAAASLTIQDLKDEQHTGIGTKVIIKLPLIE